MTDHNETAEAAATRARKAADQARDVAFFVSADWHCQPADLQEARDAFDEADQAADAAERAAAGEDVDPDATDEEQQEEAADTASRAADDAEAALARAVAVKQRLR